MDQIRIKYSATDKAQPPQPIRMPTDGWGGLPQKTVDGSEPQPWHCLPFVEGSTYGLELIYPYETECRVIHENGTIRFDWDFRREPGVQLTGGEFMAFSPPSASKYYLFNTKLDLQPPSGYVLRTEPHPRFFTADQADVPMPMIGHLQNQWYSRRLFVVFRSPRKGETHVFRKGEPYAQVLFVPQRASYALVPMTSEEDAARRKQEADVDVTKSKIAEYIWQSPGGAEFNNHYKVLARAFGRDGSAGVLAVISDGMEKHAASLPKDKSIPECLMIGQQLLAERKNNEARAVFVHILQRDPQNAQAMTNLGICAASMGHATAAIHLMSRAVALQPRVPLFHANLGELFHLMGKFAEAESSFRAASQLDPRNPGSISSLGLTLAHLNRFPEALQLCRSAQSAAPQNPVITFRLGAVLALQGDTTQARQLYQTAIAQNPNFIEAKLALEELERTNK